ncbi:MAG: hypothetical protein DRJ64_08775 [Thermoprotei archaeon]|nr:MAG: hypothetical protein DRJ64_08775 [Thermoprotei archaeon]
MVRKIPSGVPGLDLLSGGGINTNTATVVIGGSGAGKTLFATQFLKRGLEDGCEGIYITLDEPPKQILQSSLDMGWTTLERAVESEQLVFVDASGRALSDFIRKELPDFTDEWKGSRARIVIDPLTPVLWVSSDKYQQRDLVSQFFRETKKIGTVLCTLEEHGSLGNLSHPDTIIPMYLADAVIHLRYAVSEEVASRKLKIIKFRRSRHSTRYHRYHIIHGLGLLVEALRKSYTREEVNAALKNLPEDAQARVRDVMRHVDTADLRDVDATYLLALLIKEHGGLND